MDRNRSSRHQTNAALITLFSVFFLVCPTFSYAQSPVNFAGTWIQDTVKSDDFYNAFEVNYTITQTPTAFKVKQTFTMKGTSESMTEDYSFTLDGKVTLMKKESGMEKGLAQWSSDRKTLTTRSTITYGNEDVGFTETYSLSDNGLVLTAVKSNIIPEIPSVKQVFNKKL